MPYGEMRFDDEEDLFEGQCKYCGRVEGHDRDCIMNTDELYEIDKDSQDDFKEI